MSRSDLTLVLGAAESGVGAAMLAKKLGQRVVVSDAGPIQPHFRQELERRGIAFEQSGHSKELLDLATLVVKSPGIPNKAPVIQQLKARKVPVISEIEYAYRYCGNANIIAVTGSNGKSTTTSLIHRLLLDAGINAALGGNIGVSFAALVAEQPAEWYVLEVSSFQLDDVYTFRPHIALLLNITENHLDRYDYQLAKYADAKMKIGAQQTSDDWFIYGADSEALIEAMDRHPDQKGRRLAFSQADLDTIEAEPRYADVVSWVIPDDSEPEAETAPEPEQLPQDVPEVHAWTGHRLTDEPCPPPDAHASAAQPTATTAPPHLHPIILVDMNKDRRKKRTPDTLAVPTADMNLKGKHNAYNAMAAAIVGNVVNIRNEVVRESLQNFEALEHRLEPVREVTGVQYINDSKATSVNAAWYALSSIAPADFPNIVWIVGGVDKGNDYGMLLELVETKVKAIIMLGKDVAKIQSAFTGKVKVIRHALSMESAVQMAYQEGRSGDTVILSPACASFDMFANFEERGKRFKDCVARLENER